MLRARLAVLLALALAPAAAGAGAPPCDARFLVQGEPLLGGSPEVLDVDEEGVSILDLCGKKKARARITPEGARVRVRFTTFCPAGSCAPTRASCSTSCPAPSSARAGSATAAA